MVVYPVRDAKRQCRSEFAVGGGAGEDRARKNRGMAELQWSPGDIARDRDIRNPGTRGKTMEETMAAKTTLVADFIRQEGVGPNEYPEFGLGLAVALLLQLSTTEQIKYALATIKGGYS